MVCGFVLAGLLRHVLPAEAPDLARYREVRDFVRANYVEEVSEDRLVEQALHGMVEGLDRYSRYLGADQVARFERETAGSYRGIGVVFKEPLAEARVLFVMPKSPAERAGVRAGDRVTGIDGEPTDRLAPGELQTRIGRSSDDELELTVAARDGTERTLTMQRAELVDPSVRHERLLDAKRGIGYLAVTSFSHHTADEFDAAFEALRRRGMKALVLDLRGNPGGVLVAAVRIANRFIAHGLIVSTEGRDEVTRYDAQRSEARFAGTPLVVVVDEDSASASEVLAGALQDHRVAVLVGSPTYGKGMVQRIRGLSDGRGVIKLTSSYYYTPAHRNLERSLDKAWEFGLLPDLAIEVGDNERRAVRSFLAGFSPGEDALEELRAWERDEQVNVIPIAPADTRLEAAIRLLSDRGELVSSLEASNG